MGWGFCNPGSATELSSPMPVYMCRHNFYVNEIYTSPHIFTQHTHMVTSISFFAREVKIWVTAAKDAEPTKHRGTKENNLWVDEKRSCSWWNLVCTRYNFECFTSCWWLQLNSLSQGIFNKFEGVLFLLIFKWHVHRTELFYIKYVW